MQLRNLGKELKHPTLVIFLVGLVAALVVTFVLWQHQDAVQRVDDPYYFSILGRSIAEGRGFMQWNHPDLPTMRRAPLYPGMIAVLYLLGGPHTVLVRLAQCVLTGGTAAFTYAIGARVFSKQVGLIAGVLAALHPMVLRYVPDLQVESLLTFFTTAMVWCGVGFIQKPSLKFGFALGAAGALGALVKGVLVVCPPVFAVCWLLRRWRRGEPLSIAPVAAIAVAMCVVILPWTARNYKVSDGHFILISTNAGGEFLRGYVFAQPKYYLLQKRPYVDGENEANQMEIDLFKSQNLVWERDEPETERVLSKAAKEKLVSDPLALVPKTFIGLFTFWYELTSAKNSLVVGGAALGAWILAVLGILRARLQGRILWPLLQPILTINILYAILLSLGRYSAPVIPTLMVLSSWGIACLLKLEGTEAERRNQNGLSASG
ncbi:MAG TPA: glycosyltransferase family 39 protein [Polyangiaceae bacterium]|nr:glycosyltransferase family 39 protein [Polyangiaceae bacterium]